MDAKDIRNLQEAYLEVYSEAIDHEGRFHRSSGIDNEDRAYRSGSDRTFAPNSRTTPLKPSKPSKPSKPASGSSLSPDAAAQRRKELAKNLLNREQVELSNYDYHQLLKFLYFEGFADSYEEAEDLLEEVTDEEFDEIVEAFKDLTPEKEKRVLKRRDELVSKVQHHHDQMRKNADEFIRRKEGRGLIAKAKQFAVGNVGPARRAEKHIAQGKKYAQHAKNIGDALSRTQASKDASMHHQRNQIRQKIRDLGGNPDARPGFNNIRRLKREDFDVYDIILDHLLDEGFADSIETAEAIMVNMSEEWRDEIIEEFLDEATVISVTSPQGKKRALNVAKAKPAKTLEVGPERTSAIRTMKQQKVDRSFADPKKVSKFRRRYGV